MAKRYRKLAPPLFRARKLKRKRTRTPKPKLLIKRRVPPPKPLTRRQRFVRWLNKPNYAEGSAGAPRGDREGWADLGGLDGGGGDGGGS